MKVLIDADGCPVVDIAAALCRTYRIPCHIFCDTAHRIETDGAETFVLDKGADSVDFFLVNRISPGDIVITQDYGLASMALSRSARVVHQDGWEYTTDNIDALLLVRHESRKHRAASGRIKSIPKRTQQQNTRFRQALDTILKILSTGNGPEAAD